MPKTDTTYPEWLSVKSAAAYLDMSDKSVRRYISQGLLKHSRLPSGTIRVRRKDADSFMESFSIKPDELDNIVNCLVNGLVQS